MAFAGKVWKLLVGIKDGLSLIFLLLFFSLLFAILTARPSPAQVTDGALLLDLDGVVVEEASAIDPLQTLLTGEEPIGEYQVRDLVHAIDEAVEDDRIKAVVLDLSSFLGGGQVHLQEVGEALDRVRAAKKPVLTFAVAYGDDAMHLASHASEVWVDPLGGAMIAGPGGSRLYYASLLEKLNVNARVYKVGTYKSAVEPYSRDSMSPEARENYEQLYGALWEEWQANVKKARPKIDLERVTGNPVEWVEASKGDLSSAALKAGLSNPVLDRDLLQRRTPDALTLMRELKQLGAGNAASVRARGLTGKRALAKMQAAYEQLREPGGLPVTWEIVYGQAHGSAPSTRSREPRGTSVEQLRATLPSRKG